MRLTLEEVTKLRDLWALAYGSNNKTWRKLESAVQKKQAAE